MDPRLIAAALLVLAGGIGLCLCHLELSRRERAYRPAAPPAGEDR